VEARQYDTLCSGCSFFIGARDADVNPVAWRVWKDKLYLNASTQVCRRWANDIDDDITKADALWPVPLIETD